MSQRPPVVILRLRHALSTERSVTGGAPKVIGIDLSAVLVLVDHRE